MPLAQHFDDGYAIHEFSDVPAYPASHGCIRAPADEAPAVWQFGRIGMRLWTASYGLLRRLSPAVCVADHPTPRTGSAGPNGFFKAGR
jgi:hypothetical protein